MDVTELGQGSGHPRERCACKYLLIERDEWKRLPRCEPDIRCIRRPQARRADDAARAGDGAWAECHESARLKVPLEQRIDPRRTRAAPNERRDDLDIEDSWHDDLIRASEEATAILQRGDVRGLLRPQGSDGNRCVQHISQRLPRSRSSTADWSRSSALNSSMNARRLFSDAAAVIF